MTTTRTSPCDVQKQRNNGTSCLPFLSLLLLPESVLAQGHNILCGKRERTRLHLRKFSSVHKVGQTAMRGQFLKVSWTLFCCKQPPRLWASTASLPPMGKGLNHDELHQFSVKQVWFFFMVAFLWNKMRFWPRKNIDKSFLRFWRENSKFWKMTLCLKNYQNCLSFHLFATSLILQIFEFSRQNC